MDLSVVIPALHSEENLKRLIPDLEKTLAGLNIDYELLVIRPPVQGWAGALLTGFRQAQGEYILTIDPDFTGSLAFVSALWARRRQAEVWVASRYVEGSQAHMPWLRALASRALNTLFSRGLSLPVVDFSSGFRLYRASVLRGSFHAQGFEILQEILVRVYAEGWRIREMPFEYRSAFSGEPQALHFALDYLRTFWALWKLRNSILTADYDDRAYDSPIPLQRYWQRRRFYHVTDLTTTKGRALDVGCGSSRIISALPPRGIGMDILLRKLRYARKFGKPLVNGSGFCLPFPDHAFTCVICSQVIEHVPMDSPMLVELCRVLAPGGRLVLGTPDYARWEWLVTEKLYAWVAPGGYADEHIAHYTRQGLIDYFEARGFTHEATRYILRGELILAFRKPSPSDHAH